MEWADKGRKGDMRECLSPHIFSPVSCIILPLISLVVFNERVFVLLI